MRFAFALTIVFALSACRDGDRGYSLGDATYDPALLASSGGEVSLTDGTRFDFAITSDRFRQWDAARKGFGRAVAARFGALLNPAAPSERSIRRATAYLEGEPGARQSIVRAGMSVRDFVLMTVALEQQMQLASRRSAETPVAAMPPPLPPYPLADDTLAGYGRTPSYALPPHVLPGDSVRRVDTVFLPPDTMRAGGDTLRPRMPAGSRDSVRRPPRDTAFPRPPDSLPPPRDSLEMRPDSASRPSSSPARSLSRSAATTDTFRAA